MLDEEADERQRVKEAAAALAAKQEVARQELASRVKAKDFYA
jgi:hypothetical protein